MPWILVRLQALEYALLHHSHIKNPKWTIPLSFIHLYYFQATFSRLDGSKEYINYQLLLELKRDPRDPQPNAASEEMIEGACKTQWVWLLDLHELSRANFAGVTESNMRWLNMLFCGGFVQGLATGKQSTTQTICIYMYPSGKWNTFNTWMFVSSRVETGACKENWYHQLLFSNETALNKLLKVRNHMEKQPIS